MQGWPLVSFPFHCRDRTTGASWRLLIGEGAFSSIERESSRGKTSSPGGFTRACTRRRRCSVGACLRRFFAAVSEAGKLQSIHSDLSSFPRFSDGPVSFLRDCFSIAFLLDVDRCRRAAWRTSRCDCRPIHDFLLSSII